MDHRLADTIPGGVVGIFDRRIGRLGNAGDLAIHRPGDISDIRRGIAGQLADGIVCIVARALSGYIVGVADTRKRVIDMIQLVGQANIIILQLIHLVAGPNGLTVTMISKDIPIGIIGDILLVVRRRRQSAPRRPRPLPHIHMRQPVQLVILVAVHQRRIQLFDVDAHAAARTSVSTLLSPRS